MKKIAVLGLLVFCIMVLSGASCWPSKANTQIIGGDKDAHGCIGSAGYIWCDSAQKCLRTWEESCPSPTSTMMPGSDKDEHGCIGSAGYSWCELKKQCMRPWEEKCE
jgi:hypothetical protein